MIKVVHYAVGVVIAHALVGVLHGVAHQRLHVPLTRFQSLFVITIITILPLLAALLLWKRHYLSGAALLLCSMTSALCFGVYNHFLVVSYDHVSHVRGAREWVLFFQITAWFLTLSEASGALLGGWLLKLLFGPSKLVA